MPYVQFQNINDRIKSDDYWELRIHISPEDITLSNPNSKIDIIQQCLKEVFESKHAGLKVYQLTDDENDMKAYDGILYSTGKDRTQLGKEVGIFLPDAEIEQLSTMEYKEKLLLVWKKLQDKGVSLVHMTPAGDQAIGINRTNIPSPFSFTSKNPNRDEWKDDHGILMKQFEACGEHPILGVIFDIDDLIKYGINAENSFNNSIEILADRQTFGQEKIDQTLASIQEQQLNYREILFEDATSKNILTLVIEEYNKLINGADKRGEAQQMFNNYLDNNIEIQQLMDGYPHENDANFNASPLINELGYLVRKGALTEEKMEQIVDKLRQQYDVKIKETIAYFKHQKINYPNRDKLIIKNPLAMQCIFRQQVLLIEENRHNASIVCQNIPSKQAYKISLLEAYKASREEKSTNDYLSSTGIFSRVFGAWSKQEKYAAVDALIEVLKNSGEADEKYLDKKHIGPLQQGNLGNLVDKLSINLNNMLEPEVKSNPAC